MSRFFGAKFKELEPYTPGEQPRDTRKYVKLNTNESPFPPSDAVVEAVANAAANAHLYCDPRATDLVEALARRFNVGTDQVLVGNGSDEILDFIFMAYGYDAFPALFPDITYGFYPVFSQVNNVPYSEIPLRGDFALDLDDYGTDRRALFIIANPNAPTGIALPSQRIADFAKANPASIVVVDEAYVDFGAESCVPLVADFDNLIVVQTFSKSRSLAGARFGFAIAAPDLIADLQAMRYSTNPYNVNAMTQAAARVALENDELTRVHAMAIASVREYTRAALEKRGFSGTDSSANFLFVRHDFIGGAELYARLKQAGILVRHFDKPRIEDYLRITIGTSSQMETLIEAIDGILDAEKR